MSLFEKVIAVLVILIIAVVVTAKVTRAEVDSNSALHYGISAGAGFMAGVATQNIETPWLRRTVAGGLCMTPGVLKEAGDAKWSWADIAFDALGCATGYGAFWGLNLYLTPNSVNVGGSW
jgi:uncharacterized protein YfiM (DUF2279 family)